MAQLWGGIDIGGTKLHAVVAESSGTVVGRGRKKTRGERGFAAVMERTQRALTLACEEAGVEPAALRGVGVGVPSPVRADGVAVNAPNLGWYDVPVAERLGELLGRPVVAENDCNLGTLGEARFGAARGAESVVGLFVGTGLGGGIVHQGEMIRGRSRLAAEVGHMIVQASGRRCGCGHRGCLEAYASKTGMGQRFHEELVVRGRASHLKAIEGLDLRNVKSGYLAEAYRANDAVTVEILHEAAWYLGVGVANLVTLLGPEVVVLGGGVLAALGTELIGRVRDSASAATFPPSAFGGVRLVLAALADDAISLGAIAHAQQVLGATDSATTAPSPPR